MENISGYILTAVLTALATFHFARWTINRGFKRDITEAVLKIDGNLELFINSVCESNGIGKIVRENYDRKLKEQDLKNKSVSITRPIIK